MPKISVIIPIYNVEGFLPRCLDSIINQTFDDIEIICVNDGSTDGSLKILEHYADMDKRIKIISQPNAGQSVARNNGLKHVQGEYISFIDSDDWIDKEYYEHLYNLITKKNADIAVANVKITDGQIVSELGTKNLIANNLDEKLENLSTGGVWDKIFKTKLFTENNLSFPNGRYYEDNIIALQTAYYSDKMVFTNAVAYYYFINQTGTCRSIDKFEKKCADRIYSAIQMMDFAKLHHFEQMKELKDFILRTVVADFISKKSPYYVQVKSILGRGYVFKLRLKKFIGKFIRLLYIKKDKKVLMHN